MARKPDRSVTIILIAVFKLLKALMILGVSIAAFHLVNKDLGETITNWATWLHVAPGNHHLQALIAGAANVSPKKLELVGVVGLLYAGMFGTEGVGLMLGKRWAEYMTVFTTAGLLPFEIYELFHKASGPKAVALIINVAAVVYLIARLWKTRESHEASRGNATETGAPGAGG